MRLVGVDDSLYDQKALHLECFVYAEQHSAGRLKDGRSRNADAYHIVNRLSRLSLLSTMYSLLRVLTNRRCFRRPKLELGLLVDPGAFLQCFTGTISCAAEFRSRKDPLCTGL
ncbi:hypothetical protein BDQ17DRAFT_529833 [Cyathus striatus]|nr:hypothetical protein BDQ17DRAFT_529833 [Cyathus striatus]